MAISTVSLLRYITAAVLAVLVVGSYAPRAEASEMNAQEQAAYRPLQLFLDGLAKRDEALMAAQFTPGFRATLMRERKAQELDRDEFLGRLRKGATQDRQEQVNDPLVKVDDNVAMIWAPYVFYIDGKQHHCGTNVVILVNVDGKWLISAVADTARPTCKKS